MSKERIALEEAVNKIPDSITISYGAGVEMLKDIDRGVFYMKAYNKKKAFLDQYINYVLQLINEVEASNNETLIWKDKFYEKVKEYKSPNLFWRDVKNGTIGAAIMAILITLIKNL
jgi:hypothetical protein